MSMPETPAPEASDDAAIRARRRRHYRDLLFLAGLCLLLLSPWIADAILGRWGPPPPVASPAPKRAILPIIAKPPQDPLDKLALDSAQEGVREVLAMRDSSAPPPVFDPAQLRIEHPDPDLWIATGIVSTAWQMVMAAPHLYRVEVDRICHIAAPSCFKTRSVSFDGKTLLDGGRNPGSSP